MLNSSPPLIGITTYHRNENNAFTLPAEYVDSVRRADGIPILIPPGEKQLDEMLSHLDGLILSGGGDVDPALYGGEPHQAVYNVSPERDNSEATIVSKLVDSGLPMLCICRGLQMLNVALGGTLIGHLPEVVGEEVPHRAPPRNSVMHPVQIQPDSKLAEIMQGDWVETASWHHQAPDQVAPALKVVATAPDGVLEALEMPNHPWLVAVQWHPELTAAYDPTQQRLFDTLVEAARRK
ncbi:MAG: gamma-glutamyl-gamma-aminobutyrate hydrolase family protein [Chloroflexi bacterium]|nr:gamma-glutamyl-gamma-aminobutyrate hydrolase family protein [Chloroflexota bacterium]